MSAAARRGFQQRMRGDATLTALLSTIAGQPAIVQGWPFDVLAGPDPGYFPRLTWFVPTGEQIGAPKDKNLLVQIDEWVWPKSTTTYPGGGHGRLEAIDARVVVLFDNAVWWEDGTRLSSTIGPERDFPRGEESQPLRRMRMISVQAS